jgi:uncharacterized membrane protein YvbJ
MSPSVCPNCGADVPPDARACPECGSDEKTGWSEDARQDAKYAELDLPDEEFNYDEFVEREFGGNKPKPRGISWFWWLIAAVLVIIFVAIVLR